LPATAFELPKAPLIDGRGHIWYPQTSDRPALYDYTLNHQVVCPFDFSRAITNGLKEFAPDALILLGPGTTLIGAVAQTIVQNGWNGIADKADPFLLSLGMAEHRKLAVAKH
jgi:hypothetical protein